jgi:hypothetical protein
MAIPTLKYQIGNPIGWPVNGGALLIPPSTIIDTSTTAWAFLANVPPPIDAIPLDQLTYNYMTNSNGVIGCGYFYWQVKPGPGVVPFSP